MRIRLDAFQRHGGIEGVGDGDGGDSGGAYYEIAVLQPIQLRSDGAVHRRAIARITEYSADPFHPRLAHPRQSRAGEAEARLGAACPNAARFEIVRSPDDSGLTSAVNIPVPTFRAVQRRHVGEDGLLHFISRGRYCGEIALALNPCCLLQTQPDYGLPSCRAVGYRVTVCHIIRPVQPEFAADSGDDFGGRDESGLLQASRWAVWVVAIIDVIPIGNRVVPGNRIEHDALARMSMGINRCKHGHRTNDPAEFVQRLHWSTPKSNMCICRLLSCDLSLPMQVGGWRFWPSLMVQ